MTCPKCGSADVRKATVAWQCLTCAHEWTEIAPDWDGNGVMTSLERRLPDGTMLHLYEQLFNYAVCRSSPESWTHGTMDDKW